MSQEMTKQKNKKSLQAKGLIVFISGFFAVMIFMTVGIGGLLREIARLTVLLGIVLIVIGLAAKAFKKS